MWQECYNKLWCKLPNTLVYKYDTIEWKLSKIRKKSSSHIILVQLNIVTINIFLSNDWVYFSNELKISVVVLFLNAKMKVKGQCYQLSCDILQQNPRDLV